MQADYKRWQAGSVHVQADYKRWLAGPAHCTSHAEERDGASSQASAAGAAAVAAVAHARAAAGVVDPTLPQRRPRCCSTATRLIARAAFRLVSRQSTAIHRTAGSWLQRSRRKVLVGRAREKGAASAAPAAAVGKRQRMQASERHAGAKGPEGYRCGRGAGLKMQGRGAGATQGREGGQGGRAGRRSTTEDQHKLRCTACRLCVGARATWSIAAAMEAAKAAAAAEACRVRGRQALTPPCRPPLAPSASWQLLLRRRRRRPLRRRQRRAACGRKTGCRRTGSSPAVEWDTTARREKPTQSKAGCCRQMCAAGPAAGACAAAAAAAAAGTAAGAAAGACLGGRGARHLLVVEAVPLLAAARLRHAAHGRVVTACGAGRRAQAA